MRKTSMPQTIIRSGDLPQCNCCVGTSGSGVRGGQRDSPPCRNETPAPAQQMDTKLRKQETMRDDSSDGFEHPQGSANEVRGCHRCRQSQTQSGRLFLKTANPELPALIRHACWCCRAGGSSERETVEQPRGEELSDHGDAEPQPGQGELREQRNRAFTCAAQVSTNANDSVKGDIHDGAAVKAMTGQRMLGPALRAVVRAVPIRIGDLFGVTRDGASEWV